MDRIEQTIRLNDESKQKKVKFRYNLLMAIAAAMSLIAIYFLMSIFMILSNPELSINAFDLVPLLVSLVLTFVCLNKKDTLLIEYDYIVEDDHFIIAKIKNLKSRKEVINVPVSALKRLDAYNPDNFKELQAKKFNCSLNDDAVKYVLTFERGERCAVVFEPKEELLEMIKKELRK